MDFIADIFLGTGALAAALYCLILSRKLNRLKGLDQDLGGAIATLSQQVDEMTKALGAAQDAAKSSANKLDDQTKRAEGVSDKLEILMAALHDISDAPIEEKKEPAPVAESAPEPTPEPVPEEPASEAVSVFVRNPTRTARAAG